VTKPIWQWDETIQRGTDYASLAKVETYDKYMAILRNVSAEAERILHFLALSPDDVILEVGAGTGAFARAAARHCRTVIAIDVSPAMLTYASAQAKKEGVTNIIFRQAGFLTYEHEGKPLAAVVTQLALHHLPDAWKLVALKRLCRFMRARAKLYISDVVLQEEMAGDPVAYVEELLREMPEDHREAIVRHVGQEFSTFDWAMKEILSRAGFVVEEADTASRFLAHYHCAKT